MDCGRDQEVQPPHVLDTVDLTDTVAERAGRGHHAGGCQGIVVTVKVLVPVRRIVDDEGAVLEVGAKQLENGQNVVDGAARMPAGAGRLEVAG